MDEEKCFEYLEEKQFKNGVHCLLRGGTLIREPKKYNGRYYCASCNHFFSLKKGIHFEHSPFGVMQKVAWHMQKRIREHCVSDTDLSSGIVELDETYIGKEVNKHLK